MTPKPKWGGSWLAVRRRRSKKVASWLAVGGSGAKQNSSARQSFLQSRSPPGAMSLGDLRLTEQEIGAIQGDQSDATFAKKLVGAREVLEAVPTDCVYSICTMVTNFAEYNEMCRTFLKSGFGRYDCEYLYIDNTSGNKFDGFAGFNLFLSNSKGNYIILCHQDVRVVFDDRAKLDAIIGKLYKTDPNWGVVGNCGGISPGLCAMRLTDPHGVDQREGQLPAKVSSLDENFIVARRAANLSVSRDLSGFHLYGTDICIISDILGWSAYVVDFHLHHLSSGVKGLTFAPQRKNMIRQYKRKLSDRLIKSPSTIMYLSRSSARNALINVHQVTRLLEIIGKLWNRSAAIN